MRPVLSVRNLRIIRGRTRILSGLDWRIDPGQHWVILGPNGPGKTSLLRAITGYFTPTAGEIAVLHRQFGLSDWRDLRKAVGVVTSVFASSIPDTETARDTVISGRYAQLDLWVRTTRSDRRNADRLLRSVGISRLAERPWGLLSQGERQRVLIARALMARPRLLLLDEPCAGLDPVAREHFLAFMERLGRRHTVPTLVLVTHHVEDITPAFTHVLLLRSGRVVASGPKRRALTSATLTRAFGSRIRLSRTGRRFRLTAITRTR